MIIFHQQIHAALHGAIGAVSWHDFVDDAISPPSAVRRVVKMRTILCEDLIEMFDSAHGN
jgi:hypothetical protein